MTKPDRIRRLRLCIGCKAASGGSRQVLVIDHGSWVIDHSIMPDFTQKILAAVARKSYQPLKPKALARKIGVPAEQYTDFRRALRDLLKQGRVVMGKNHTIRPAQASGTVAGTFHKTSAGYGFVRPHAIDGQVGPEVLVRQED